MDTKIILRSLCASLLLLSACSNKDNNETTKNTKSQSQKEHSIDRQLNNADKKSGKPFSNVAYPNDGVKGIYVTANSTKGEKFEELTNFIDQTDLNAMVIDVKDDNGNITINFNTGDKLIDNNSINIVDAKPLLKKMGKKNIYPIARIVTFKDTKLAEKHPEWSFKNPDGSVWENGGGDKFVNPFMKEVWKYNIDISKQAAKAGFKDIQYDYVRFPEEFEGVEKNLTYNKEDYKDSKLNEVDQRVDTITQFLRTARHELTDYDVKVSADVFGYAAMVEEAPGIGQSFQKISKNVDAISSMIYPSHWSSGDFGIKSPDLEPYNTIDQYLDKETAILNELGKDKPKSRPWLQDFTASYLGAGNYKVYDKQAIEEQIQSLADHGINEFLLWNAPNDYTQGINYNLKPNKDKLKVNEQEIKKIEKNRKQS